MTKKTIIITAGETEIDNLIDHINFVIPEAEVETPRERSAKTFHKFFHTIGKSEEQLQVRVHPFLEANEIEVSRALYKELCEKVKPLEEGNNNG